MVTLPPHWAACSSVQPLFLRSFSQYPNWTFPCATSGHFLLSLLPGRRGWLPLCYTLLSGSCREQWGLPGPPLLQTEQSQPEKFVLEEREAGGQKQPVDKWTGYWPTPLLIDSHHCPLCSPMRWFLGTGLPSFQQSYQSVTLFITGRKSQHQKSFLYRVTFEIYHGVVSPRADSKVTGGAVSWLLFCLLAPGVWERAINNTPRCGRVQLLKALNLLAAAVFQGGVLPPWSLQGQRCCRRRGGRSLERVGCVLGELLPWRDAKVRAWLKNLLPLLKSLLLYDIVFHRRRFS